MIYLNLLAITLIVVLIVDISGITEHISKWISHTITKGKFIATDIVEKIGICSFCVNFWCGLGYLILMNSFSIFNLLFVLVCSFFTPTITGLLYLLRDLINKVINSINKKISA